MAVVIDRRYRRFAEVSNSQSFRPLTFAKVPKNDTLSPLPINVRCAQLRKPGRFFRAMAANWG